MAETFARPYIQVKNQEEAIAVWSEHAALHGAMGNGIYLTDNPGMVSGMKHLIGGLVPRNTVVSNMSGLPHAFFQYPSGAVLRLSPISCLEDALPFSGQGFNWMAIHEPQRWLDKDLIERMLMVLDSQNVETRLVSVGSPLHFPSAVMDAPLVPMPEDLDVIAPPADPTHIARPHSDEPSG